jgi:DNA-binding GntR family transcriptional regulator
VVLEGAAAERAAEYITNHELEQLEMLADDEFTPRQRETYQSVLAKNRAFHLLIARASRNSYLVQGLEAIFDQVDRMCHLYLDVDDSAESMHSAHQALIEALRRGDGAAAQKISEASIRRGQEQVLRAIMQARGQRAARESETPASTSTK